MGRISLIHSFDGGSFFFFHINTVLRSLVPSDNAYSVQLSAFNFVCLRFFVCNLCNQRIKASTRKSKTKILAKLYTIESLALEVPIVNTLRKV